MSEPTPEEIRDLFAKIPRLPPEPPSTRTATVICSYCWEKWLREGVLWRSMPVHVVTVHKGQALCEEHFKDAVGISVAADS